MPFLLGTTQTSATFTGGVLHHTYGFSCVATDNVGNRQAVPTAAQTSTTYDNPPVATVSLDAQTPLTNDLLTATAITSDPNDDPVSLTFVWKVNGVVKRTHGPVADLTDSFELSLPGNGNVGDVITVEVTPNDGFANGPIAADNATVFAPCNLDADGNGIADALSDGILILRYLFDPTGAWNVNDALGSGCSRTTREVIKGYLDGGRTTALDVDGNGTADALSDGILILRYLFEPDRCLERERCLGQRCQRGPHPRGRLEPTLTSSTRPRRPPRR